MVSNLKYKHEDSQIVLHLASKNGNVFDISNASLYVDGVECPIKSGLSMRKGTAILPNGETAEISVKQSLNHAVKFSDAREFCSVSINGRELEEYQHTPHIERSFEHLKDLSNGPISGYSDRDFIAIKSLNRDGCASVSRDSTYYLYIGEGKIPKEIGERKNFIDKAENKFVKINFRDIKPGDNILIQPPYGWSLKLPEPIVVNDVSFASTQKGFWSNVHTIEGDGIFVTDADLDHLRTSFIQSLEEIGLSPEDFWVVRDMPTMDEFLCVRELQESGINITDQMLRDLVDGKSVESIIEMAQDIDKNGFDCWAPEIGD